MHKNQVKLELKYEKEKTLVRIRLDCTLIWPSFVTGKDNQLGNRAGNISPSH